ncbi:MAG: hypothetical protein ABSD63_01430 [Candidatus Korobacteraceae bacterium]|jgi:hypothetical protein
MNVLCKTWFVAFLSAVAIQPLLLAQSPEPSHTIGCEESHRVIAPRNPRMGTDGNILAGQAIVQARLVLDGNTNVKVVEYPRSLKNFDSYNSTVIIQRGQERKEYPIGRLIKFGSNLRVVEIASLCTSSNQGTVFLAFETPSVAATEGFAVIRFSPGAVDVQAFPMANQGRIVISKAEPDKVELWSATGSASQMDCDACKKHYAVQDCNVGPQSVECKQRSGPGEVLFPDRFMGARIEVR